MLRIFFLFFFLFSSLVFSFLPSEALANVCLHPLEQAALLSGKSQSKSLSSQIQQIKKAQEKLLARKTELEDQIAGYVDDLDNSLAVEKHGKTKISSEQTEDAAEAISEYIEAKQDKWEQENWVEEQAATGTVKAIAKIPVEWYDSTKSSKAKKYFKRNGEVKERSFCKDYTNDKKNCEKVIKNLEKHHKKLFAIRELGEQRDELIEDLEERESDRVDRKLLGLEDEEDTEASPLCFECLDQLRELDKPTSGQIFGSVLSTVAGGALSYYGYKAGKREGRALNDLRIRAGYDPRSSAGLSWAGASIGGPFIANGIYGLAGGNSKFGNLACSNGFASGNARYSPFGHYNNNAQANMRFGPGGWPGAFNPNMNAQANMRFGPGGWPGAFNPNMNAQANMRFGPGGWPGAFNPNMNAQANMRFGPGGWPGAFNPNMNAQANMQFGPGGWPGAFNPNMNAQANMRFGPGGWPGAFNPNMNAQANMQFGPGGLPNPYGAQQYTQYMQFQQQQMQAKMQAQQAWMQHQISIQKDWMHKQQVIGSLTQEIVRIKQQIHLVASGGVSSGLLASGNFNASLNLGNSNFNNNFSGGSSSAPTHNPAPAANTAPPGGKIPVIEGR